MLEVDMNKFMAGQMDEPRTERLGLRYGFVLHQPGLTVTDVIYLNFSVSESLEVYVVVLDGEHLPLLHMGPALSGQFCQDGRDTGCSANIKH